MKLRFGNELKKKNGVPIDFLNYKIVGNCNLFYEKKPEKFDFTHIVAKIYTTPFAGCHFNTVARIEYVTKTIFIINFFPSSMSTSHRLTTQAF